MRRIDKLNLSLIIILFLIFTVNTIHQNKINKRIESFKNYQIKWNKQQKELNKRTAEILNDSMDIQSSDIEFKTREMERLLDILN